MSEKEYSRADAMRDLDPHKPARAAMWIFGDRYAKSGLGSMGFWDSLHESEKNIARECVTTIEMSRDEERPR